MIALIIIGICIIPALANILFVYICFKQKYKEQSVTIEDFVNYWDDIPTPLVLMPPFSIVYFIAEILYIITYPVQVLILNWYKRIKHKKI